jgi:hypothetical protein
VVEAALRAEGLHVERQDRTDGLVEEWPGWEEEIGGGLGEWVITAPGGEEMVLQMAHFDRSRSPVIIDTVPVRGCRPGSPRLLTSAHRPGRLLRIVKSTRSARMAATMSRL